MHLLRCCSESSIHYLSLALSSEAEGDVHLSARTLSQTDISTTVLQGMPYHLLKDLNHAFYAFYEPLNSYQTLCHCYVRLLCSTHGSNPWACFTPNKQIRHFPWLHYHGNLWVYSLCTSCTIILGPTSWVMFRWLPEGAKRSPEAAQLSPSASCRKPPGDSVFSLFTSSQALHYRLIGSRYLRSMLVQLRLDQSKDV